MKSASQFGFYGQSLEFPLHVARMSASEQPNFAPERRECSALLPFDLTHYTLPVDLTGSNLSELCNRTPGARCR
jgi:hypothetical protein